MPNRLIQAKTKCGHGRAGLKGKHGDPKTGKGAGRGRPDTPCPYKKYRIPRKKK